MLEVFILCIFLEKSASVQNQWCPLLVDATNVKVMMPTRVRVSQLVS